MWLTTARGSAHAAEVLYPEQFGARGNGWTNDTAAFGRLYAAARQRGATVALRQRIYIATADISGVRTLGNGAIIKAPARNKGAVLRATRPFHLRDVALQSRSAASSGGLLGGLLGALTLFGAGEADPMTTPGTIGVAIDVPSGGFTTSSSVTNVSVSGADFGIRLCGPDDVSDPRSTPSSNVTLRTIDVSQAAVGLWVSRSTAGTVDNYSVSSPRLHGMLFTLTRRWTVSNARVTNAAEHGVVVLYSDTTNIQGSVIEKSGRSGIVYGGGSPARRENRNCSILNNTSTGNGHSGITCDSTRQGQTGHVLPFNSLISGNVCSANTKHGIVLTCAGNGTVTGNRTTGNGRAGISLATSHAQVLDNVSRDNGTYGVAAFGGPERPEYGWHRIGPNRVAGNRLRGTYDATGTSTVS